MSCFYAETPVKYNGCQLDSTPEPFLLTVDYLKLNFIKKSDIPAFTESLIIHEEDYGTRFFKNRYSLTWKGQDFGTIIANPRADILDKDLVQITVANHNLYNQINLSSALADIMHELGLTFHSINRLDVAYDCHRLANGKTPLEVVTEYKKGNILLKGRKRDEASHGSVIKGKSVLTGYSWGTRENSERYLRIYDKTIEMQKQEKPHIIAAWEKAGLDRNQPVYRTEIQLSNRWFKKYAMLWAQPLRSGKELLEVFQKGIANYWEFVINEGKSEKNKNTPYPLFDWKALSTRLQGAYDGLIKRTANVKKQSKRAKQITLKGMIRQYFETGQQPIFAQCAAVFMLENNLVGFYQKKIPDWYTEFYNAATAPESLNYQLLNEHLEEC